jgi:hypothetical protein
MILEKVYANMSACHIKQENWKRAVDTADKVCQPPKDNFRVLSFAGS